MNKYQRIFGSGVFGLAVSSILLLITTALEQYIHSFPLIDSRAIRVTILALSVLATTAIVIWSVKSLPIESRGRELVQTGAFALLRHPLYGAFLCFFNFGLAIFLNHYIYLIWAISLHPLWHCLIRYEESLMINYFGVEYQEYMKKTSRFFPLKYFITCLRKN